jgi:tungstate transport system ATP-binding protein
MMAMLDAPSILPMTAKALSFAAGGKVLLDNVSFSLPRGGLMALVGPNGSGKSLTLRLCHGLLTPTSGQVSWAIPSDMAGWRRHAMVFQKPVMLRRSARANIVHALAAVGMDRRAREMRSNMALERFGMRDFAGLPARLLSGGEQQRLAIARAWAMSPEILFLDEPTSQLDPGATRQIEEMLVTLKTEGVTLVMASHDMGQVRRIADRVLFLNRGRLVEDTPTRIFFDAPSSGDARAFVSGDLVW